MIGDNFKSIEHQLDEVSKFIKLGRKKIAQNIKVEIKKLVNENDKRQNEFNGIIQEKDKTLKKLANENIKKTERLNFISSILSANPSDNKFFINLKKMMQVDFIEFANSESSLAEEAAAILKLQEIEKDIELIVNFEGVYGKNIIAIGGGFSSGKSEFVSSFFQDEKITLPIGIEPVTAIPTYITASQKNIIRGFSKKGGTFRIEPDLYKKLSHNFVKSFSFNLKDIMPLMSIETPFLYENICFVDTPGYNPSDILDGYTKEDTETAKEYLERANVLIWLIGLDSNGTISTSDLAFWENLSLENKKLYIVANKADLKSENDIEDILDTFEEVLDDYEMEYAGISAYSSTDKEELTYRKCSLYGFLDQQNTTVAMLKKIITELTEIFNDYENAIKEDIKNAKQMKKNFKSLELDVLETQFDNDNDKIYKRIEKMKKFFNTEELEKHLKTLNLIKKKILDEIENLFNSLNVNA